MAKIKTKTKARPKTRKTPKARPKVKARSKLKTRTKAKTVVKKKSKRKSPLSQINYNVSSELAAIVGSQRLTRPQIVKKLWAYIKSHKCQDTKNRRLIVPDNKLSIVLGKKPVDMLKLAG